jgi:receptor protein-tyrosine kinase
MNLPDVWRALKAGWWLPLLGMIIGGGLALGMTSLQPPLYTSTTQLFVSTTAATSSADAFQGGQFSQQRAASYARLIGGQEMATRVVARLKLDVPPATIAEGIAASAVPGTVLIDVVVVDESPQRAAEIAEAVGSEFPAFVQELEVSAPGGDPLVRVAVTDPPEVPSVPSSPRVARDTALGVAVGLLLGALAAVARARLDRTVKDPEEGASLAAAPVIGLVLRDERLAQRHIADTGGSATAEEYRQLRTNLQFLSVDEPPKVIMISSALPMEGKTTTVVNLGIALAEAGHRVTIVDADLRRPRVTHYLGLVGGVGLTNVLAGTADVEEVLQRHGTEQLFVMGAGPLPPNPGELLASSHMAELVGKLRAENDFVLFDAPPVLPVADAAGLAVSMDGAVLVVRFGKTRKEELRSASAALDRVGARMLGIILGMVPPSAEIATPLASGYHYRDRPGEGPVG